jgi:hypothetical protein
MSESESSLRTMGFYSTFGLGLFRASLDMSQALFLPLSSTVGLPLTFLLTGFFIASTVSAKTSGRLILGSIKGLGKGNRTWKGTGGPTLVSLTTDLSIWIGSVSAKPFREIKACQLSP